MKQKFTVEFDHNRKILPTEIIAAIFKLIGVWPISIDVPQPTGEADAEKLYCCEHMAQDERFCTHIGDIVQ